MEGNGRIMGGKYIEKIDKMIAESIEKINKEKDEYGKNLVKVIEFNKLKGVLDFAYTTDLIETDQLIIKYTLISSYFKTT